MTLTVYFDGQYWCGLIEYENNSKQLVVFIHVFGNNPSETELFEFIHLVLPQLIEQNWFGSLISNNDSDKKKNPKRMQREINRRKSQPAISTKSQLAMSEQLEAKKQLKKAKKSQRKAEMAKERFEQKQLKRKEKHKGH